MYLEDEIMSKEFIKQSNHDIPEERLINIPEQILQIMHEKKQIILFQLFHKAMTIQELKERTGLNPGTIKRFLDQLMIDNLVFVEYSKRNEYNILMKFYRTTAKKFRISILLPDDLNSSN